MWLNEGYDLKKAFDLNTESGQLAVIGINSLMLSAPGDILLLVKSKQKFAQYIAKRGGESVNPLILDIDRQLDLAIQQNKYKKSEASPLTEDIEEPPMATQAPMSELLYKSRGHQIKKYLKRK